MDLLKSLGTLGGVKQNPQDIRRNAAIAIGGRVVASGGSVEEYVELLLMLGIIGAEEETNYEEQDKHDYQSSYRHYRNISIA